MITTLQRAVGMCTLVSGKKRRAGNSFVFGGNDGVTGAELPFAPR